MLIDLPTLMVAGSFVSAISGVFLIFAWLQTDRAHGMLWWAAADLVLATAIPIMASPNLDPGEPPLVVAITLLNLSPALIWASARAVNNRRVDLAVVGTGAVLWLVAYAMPIVREETRIQVALNLLIAAFYLGAAAYEFWKGRDEKLMSRWPLIVLLGLHAVFSAGAAVSAFIGDMAPSGIAVLYGWFGFVHLETLAFVVGTSIFTVAMARERNEIVHKTAASTDALTGVATRRAFYDKGETMVGDSIKQDSALAIILFDLDAFKKINDTFGHGPGDEVLKRFGAAALKTLRSSDLIGRLGGEEFGAVLPGASVGAAYVAAERIRVAFSDACASLNDGMIKATVSAGIAQAQAGSTLDSLVQAADLALYRAKLQGRNRVEVAEKNDPPAEDPASAALKVA
ncbi:MAG TPA: GGDEF domain-containing protein [Bauldia sp.]|nr:GGDEF domain-containing protein [Bauldia sp.]